MLVSMTGAERLAQGVSDQLYCCQIQSLIHALLHP